MSQKIPSQFLRVASWLVAVAVVLGHDPLLAQDSTGVVPDSEEAIVAPGIPLSQIGDRTEEVATHLRAAVLALEPDPDVDDARQRWPELQTRLADLHAETAEASGRHVNLIQIDELLRRWEEGYGELEDLEEVVSGRIADLSFHLTGLSDARTQWAQAQSRAAAEDLPETIVTQIDSVLSVIDRILPSVRVAVDSVLELRGQMTYADVAAVSSQERLQRLRSRIFSDRFSRVQTPLWRLFADRPPTELETVRQRRFGDAVQISVEYLRKHVKYLVLHLILIVLLTLAFAPLGRRLEEIAEVVKPIRAPVAIFKWPFLPALLLGFIGTSIVYPNPPSPLVSLVTILSIPITIALLVRHTRSELHPMLFGVGAMVILFVIARLAIPRDTPADRLAMLGLALVVLCAAIWFLRPGGTREILQQAAFGRLLLAIVKVGLLLAGLSVVGDVFGYVEAAQHATQSIMIGTYSGLYIYVGVQILIGALIATVHTGFAGRINAVSNHKDSIVRGGVRLLNVAAFLYWIYISLELLGLYRPLENVVANFVTRPLGMGEFEFTLLDIIAFVVTLWVSVKISQLIRVLLSEDVLGRMTNLARGLPVAISSLTFYFLVGLSFAIALSAAGVPLDRLALLTGALGIGIGFGLQDIVRNFVSGLILMIERPVKVGDTVEVAGNLGSISKIGIRSSILRGFEGVDVIVPNSHLVTSDVKNWTLVDNSRRIDVNLTVDYDADPQLVSDILLNVGMSYDKVDHEPEAAVVFTGFNDRGMGFSLRCWVSDSSGWLGKRNELSAEAYRRLKEAGVKFPKVPAVISGQ